MKKLLIVVDYQEDFVTGSLGFKKAQEIENNIEKIITNYEKERQDIVFTLDTHDDTYLSTIEGNNLPIPHCLLNTNGHKVYGRIYSYSLRHPNFVKNTFGSTKLAEYLANHSYDIIELVGVVSNICVLSNAIICKTYQPNALINIYKDCCASNDIDMEEKGFAILQNLHIKII